MLSALTRLPAQAESSAPKPRQRVWFSGNRLAVPNGANLDLKRPTPVAWFEERAEVRWKQITFGPHFGAALGSREVFVWGYNHAKDEFAAPRKIDLRGEFIIEIHTTDDALFLLT